MQVCHRDSQLVGLMRLLNNLTGCYRNKWREVFRRDHPRWAKIDEDFLIHTRCAS